PDTDQIKEAVKQREDAEAELKRIKSDSRSAIRPKLTKKAQAEADYQSVKADYDSVSSLYNLAVEKRDEAAGSDQYQVLQQAVDRRKAEVQALEQKLINAQNELDKATRDLKEAQEAQTKAEEVLSKAEDNLKKV